METVTVASVNRRLQGSDEEEKYRGQQILGIDRKKRECPKNKEWTGVAVGR